MNIPNKYLHLKVERNMSHWFRRFLGLILLIATVGIATCQSLVKADDTRLTNKPNIMVVIE